MKSLSKILDDYTNITKDTKKFIEKHSIKKTEDANGNDDKLFTASNINAHDRSPSHGYNPGEDKDAARAVVQAESASLEEKKLTAAEMKKREEVAQAIERENPDMPMAKKMAIATATAKRVAEETEQEPSEDELAEAYAVVLEALYNTLDEESKKIMEDMLDDDTATDELMSIAEEILQSEEISNE